jgi:hypothetical protein
MLEKISGNFGNFSLLGKVINADFYHFCPKYIGHFEKSGCLKFIGILGILILLKDPMLYSSLRVHVDWTFTLRAWDICFENDIWLKRARHLS